MPITPQLADQARRDMFSFIMRVLTFLNEIISEPTGPEGPLVLEEMIRPLQRAWAEFQKDFNVEAARERIFSMHDQVIQDHGIYGEQAGCKRKLVDILLEKFNGNKTRKALLWLLDAIDTYLDSITDAAGVSGALKEIKKLLRSTIPD